jgi:sugar O-acyltransferase (sialic acid O-acetyltransferase NeuD family)
MEKPGVSQFEQTAVAILIPHLPTGVVGDGLWLAVLEVQEGQPVEAGQLLARLEGEQSAFDLTSPRPGYIVGLHALPGQVLAPGQALCYIGPQPSAASTPALPRIAAPAPFDPTALLLLGGGGHGKILIDLIRALPNFRLVGIIDDRLAAGSDVMGVTVLGSTATLEQWYQRGVHQAANGVGGIGNVDARLQVFEKLDSAGFTCPVLVHPTAVIERSASLEAGAQILAQAYVGGAVRIGFGTVLNVGAVVSHESVLGKVVNLSPGATLAGNVRVENYAQIGMRATVNVGLTIGERALLGNGCTVKKDVPAGTRVRAGTIWPVPK